MTTACDHAILRDLGRRLSGLAALPVQAERVRRWRNLNGLLPERPLLHIQQQPWSELEAADEFLRPRVQDPFLRGIEIGLRRRLYQAQHHPDDSPLAAEVVCPLAWSDSGFGIAGQETRSADGIAGAAHYVPVIRELADVEKIRDPVVVRDDAETARRRVALEEAFAGVLPVRVRGVAHEWCAPWDRLICWYGIDQLFLDMVDRPALVHAAIGRLMDALLARRRQQQELGILDVSDGNHGVGSGGLGITDELPGPAGRPALVTPAHQWGTSTGQIFGGASPRMHDEFCLRYELRWLADYGLNCYGCCEALHQKMHLLRRIPRLRRVSISPWCDIGKAAQAIGATLVFSIKPNPAVLAADRWDVGQARRELRRSLDGARGCRVEAVLKDISTVRGEPHRLAEWAAMAAEECDRVAQAGLVTAG